MRKFLALLSLLYSFLPSAFAQQTVDVQQYKFEIELFDETNVINGVATIGFTVLSPTFAIAFDLMAENRGKGMNVHKVYLQNDVIPFQQSGKQLILNFKNGLGKGEQREVKILYSGIPADGLIISKNKWNDRTFFSDNWPNRAHHWIPCNDVPDDKAAVEFLVTAPVQYSIISNGIEVAQKVLDTKRKLTHWKETTPIPTKVMVIGAAQFAVKHYADSSVVPVSAWVYRQDSAKGFYDYALATGIVKFFSSYIGPYPYQKLANVQSKTIFGGMENASAIFYAENTVTGDRTSEALIAHEIAHQWFGNTATEKGFAHLWLSEGFATYMTHIYLEQKYGRDTLVQRLKKDRNEVSRFSQTYPHPVVDSTAELMDLLNANSYQKGGWILHMLRTEVGDMVFQKIMQAYYTQYKGGNADTKDFEAVAEKISGKNLDQFFRQWLYTAGVPKVTITWKVDNGRIKLTVKQEQQTLFTFPLRISLEDESGTIFFRTVQIMQRENSFELPVTGVVKKIIPDPDTELLFERTLTQNQ